MIVTVAATQMEMDHFLSHAASWGGDYPALVTGVGPLETAVVLGRFLAEQDGHVSGVLQFGVGGSYISPEGSDTAELMSVCLAEREVMGDLGICFPDRVDYFPKELGGIQEYCLKSQLLTKAESILVEKGIFYIKGNFVTVNGATATAARGEMLRHRWQGLCENMEGCAVARLCAEYDIPLLELRVISNLVEDRNINNWQLRQACERAGEIAALLIKELA